MALHVAIGAQLHDKGAEDTPISFSQALGATMSSHRLV